MAHTQPTVNGVNEPEGHPLLEPSSVILHTEMRGGHVGLDTYTTVEQAVESGKINTIQTLTEIYSVEEPNIEVWRCNVWEGVLFEDLNDYTIDGLKKGLHKLLQPNLYTQLGPGMIETTVIVDGHIDDSATSTIAKYGREQLQTVYNSLELGSL